MYRLIKYPYTHWIPINAVPSKGIGRRVKPGKINLAAIVKAGSMKPCNRSRLL